MKIEKFIIKFQNFTMNIFNPIDQANSLAEQFGTPIYVYDEKILRENAQQCLSFPNEYGLTVRFAMKSCPTSAILKLFHSLGIHFDASSVYEVRRAMLSGIPAEKISLSTQELPPDFPSYIRLGIKFNACSLDQLERYGEAFPNTSVGVRFNPGIGSGHSEKTTVGGPNSSFGIWHEYSDRVSEILKKHSLTLERIHTHIGSGSDPSVWVQAAKLSLKMINKFESVTTLDFGGGFRIGRVEGEQTTDLQETGSNIRDAFVEFAKETGRKIHLEIEPGTYLVGNACAIVARVHDVVDTGANGRKFIKLDTGMTEILRPSLYGSQHPINLVKRKGRVTSDVKNNYIVVGHCCESGDLISCAPNEPGKLAPRELPLAEIGDYCVICGAGAYCSGMSAKNYNSFPESAEVLVTEKNGPKLIRRRQTVEQMIQNEIIDE